MKRMKRLGECVGSGKDKEAARAQCKEVMHCNELLLEGWMLGTRMAVVMCRGEKALRWKRYVDGMQGDLTKGCAPAGKQRSRRPGRPGRQACLLRCGCRVDLPPQ